MKLSVIITTKNRKKVLLNCIKSLLDSSFNDFELIIVDDNSTDGTQNLTSKDINFPNTKIYHQDKSLTMAQARNFGAKKANGDYLLFVDDDNIVDKDMIKNLLACAGANPAYGILGPRMFYLEKRKEYMTYQTINFYTGKTKGHLGFKNKEINDSDGIPNVFMVKREVFKECGFFDSRLMQSFTEPDFAFQAKKGGYKCGICKSASTYHDICLKDNFRPRGLGGNFLPKAYCLMRNRIIFIWRYGNILQKGVFLVFFSWVYLLIYSLLVLRFGRFDLVKLYWRGYLDGLIYCFTKRIKSPEFKK